MQEEAPGQLISALDTPECLILKHTHMTQYLGGLDLKTLTSFLLGEGGNQVVSIEPTKRFFVAEGLLQQPRSLHVLRRLR